MLTHVSAQSSELTAESGKPEARDLPAQCSPRQNELLREIMFFGRSATNLAARGLWHCSGVEQNDVIGWGADDCCGGVTGLGSERFPFDRIGLLGLSKHNDAL